MPLFLFIFHMFITYIHSFHIHTIHLSIAIRWGLSPSPHCLKAQWEDPPRGAEPRIELFINASFFLLPLNLRSSSFLRCSLLMFFIPPTIFFILLYSVPLLFIHSEKMSLSFNLIHIPHLILLFQHAFSSLTFPPPSCSPSMNTKVPFL
jgi:hypothetical protein